MNDITAFLNVLIGLGLRLVIPLLITMAAVYFLRKLDSRWKEEGEPHAGAVEKPACWEINKCPSEARAKCVGFLSPLPCWQVRRLSNGYLREECLTCTVFREAPVPSQA